MGNNKNTDRGRKTSKSDYMRQARKQRQRENIFFDGLEKSFDEANGTKKRGRKKNKTAGGDDDEWE